MSEAEQNSPIIQDGPRAESEQLGGTEPGPYVAAVTAYLDEADWLDQVLDGPVVVHARSIAASLDKQLEAKGEIQSALAGSFDKCLLRLNERRPKPAGPGEPIPAGQTTVFDFLDG